MLHHPVESVNNKVTNYQIIGKGLSPHPKKKNFRSIIHQEQKVIIK